jgi:hypothetical protein
MRATINFEVDVDQVENTMATLVAMESDTLRAIADMIDVNPGPRTMVLEEVTEALRLLEETSAQLEQYKGMLLSFERARFETVLPQSADNAMPVTGQPINNLGELQNTVESMKDLQGFLDRINDQRKEGADAAPADEEG